MSAIEIALVLVAATWPIFYYFGWQAGWAAHRDRDESVRPRD